ncbi:MAG: hypothetical protein GY755_16420 [Chloroflexi bacterium]|nr:hypothetical protein [Chloroflexota bacterium]
MAKMNGRERVLAAIQRKVPDRIPTFEWDIDPGLVSSMTGGGTYDDFVEKFDLDAVMCGPTYTRKPISDGKILDEWGVTRLVGHEAYAMPVDEFAPIKSKADLDGWLPPDPHASHRVTAMLQRIDRFKGDRAIFIQLRDVWSNPRDLMGYENLLMQCALDPGFVEEVVKKCITQSIELVKIAADLGGEIVMSGDDIADNARSLISPKMYKSIFLPHFKQWVDAIHDNGMYYWKHTDGNIKAILPLMVDAGIDGIDPIDPIAGMELSKVKAEWGDKVAIKGNVDCAALLTSGTETEVEEAVKTCIREAGIGGGYVCSTSNSVHSGVKPELYIKMLASIRDYGVYPLDMEKLTPSKKLLE